MKLYNWKYQNLTGNNCMYKKESNDQNHPDAGNPAFVLTVQFYAQYYPLAHQCKALL